MADALVDAVGSLSLEDVTARQRKDRKNLQAQIMLLKKAVPKGDRKRQKEVQLQVTHMETEFEQKCQAELTSIEAALRRSEEASNDGPVEAAADNEPAPAQKTSKAEKRRRKKQLEDIERNQRIQEQEKTNANLPRAVEQHVLGEKLRKNLLEIHDIVPDGNCLFSAVSHQLKTYGSRTLSAMELRALCASHLRQHRSEFEAFVVDEDFDSYCDRIENDQAYWGGQIELRALSNQLKCRVIVYQAEGPNVVFGDNSFEKTLTVSFHRHLIKSGEHYNSVVETPLDTWDEDEEAADSQKPQAVATCPKIITRNVPV